MLTDEKPVPWSLEEGDSRQPGGNFWPAMVFWASIMGLLCLSMIMIHSATIMDRGGSIFMSQVIWVSLGMVAAVVMAIMPVNWLRKYSAYGMVVIIIPLIYLAVAYAAMKLNPGALKFFPFVPTIKGAVRWFRFPCPGLGSIQLQPSEFAKLFLLLYLSSYYGSITRSQCKEFRRGVLVPSVLAGTLCVLVLLGKDLSTTVVIGLTYFVIMYLAGVRFRYLLAIIAIGAVVGGAAIMLSPERVSRVTSYRAPETFKDDNSYQLWRSQLALGSGGMYGRGFSKGVIKTYLPEQHTDFIVAVMGEELGFLAVAGALVLYALIFLSASWVGFGSRERPDLLLCVGIGAMLAIQALINISVVSGWCPTTGVTAPFLSYGGSSMVMTLALAGLVMNVSIRNSRADMREMENSRCYLTIGGREPY
jgi:cell division protein FtsW